MALTRDALDRLCVVEEVFLDDAKTLSVYVRGLTVDEVTQVQDQDEKTAGKTLARLAICDEKGNRLYKDDENPFETIPMLYMEPILKAAARKSGMKMKGDVATPLEEAQKKSMAVGSSSSSIDLPQS